MNFQDQSIKWIQQLATRRNPIKPSTLVMYGAWLRSIPSEIASIELENFDNGVMRNLVGRLTNNYSPASVNGIIGLAKRVVTSAVDENGNELYPRKWNNIFIDLPPITGQKQPTVLAQDIENIIHKAGIKADMKVLVALLAGTGIRLGEALALKPEHIKDSVLIQSTMWRRKEQNAKTRASVREVDIIPALKDYMSSFIAKKLNKEYIFPYWPTSLYRQVSLPGFHSLRRFRVSWLRKQGVQESLIRYWIGHSPQNITDRYDKISQDAAYRQEIAIKIGLGFIL